MCSGLEASLQDCPFEEDVETTEESSSLLTVTCQGMCIPSGLCTLCMCTVHACVYCACVYCACVCVCACMHAYMLAYRENIKGFSSE